MHSHLINGAIVHKCTGILVYLWSALYWYNIRRAAVPLRSRHEVPKTGQTNETSRFLSDKRHSFPRRSAVTGGY